MAADQDRDTDPTPDLTARRNAGDLSGGTREPPTGGYQRPDAEGSRAYDPGEKGQSDTLPQRSLEEGAADEIAVPFDEDAILDRIDRERHGEAAVAAANDVDDLPATGAPLPSGAGSDASSTSDSGVTSAPSGTGASAGGDPLLGSEEVRGKRRALAPVDKSRSDYIQGS